MRTLKSSMCLTALALFCVGLLPVTPSRADILSGGFNPAVHDPSRMIYDPVGNRWLIFYTGVGVPYAISTDQVTWTHASTNRVFPSSGVGADSANYWAADMWPTPIHGQYYLFYSLSSFGSQNSFIKVASTASLTNPIWVKLGNAIASVTGNPYNTIDPCPFYDAVQDRLWITFGSFWTGIYIVELNPLDPTQQLSSPVFLAGGRPGPNAIEGSFVFQHGGYFYLNASVDTCCQGSGSTYKQIIGRSVNITGPYLDRDGVDLRKYGGTIFTAGADSEIGPGQFGLYSLNGTDRFTYHLYSNTNGGGSVLGGRAIDWDASGWPLAVYPTTIPGGVYKIQRQGTSLYLHARNESTDPTIEGHIEQDVLAGRPSQNWLFFPHTSAGGDTYLSNIQNGGTKLWFTIASTLGDSRAVVTAGTDFVRQDYAHDLSNNEDQKWRVIVNSDGSYSLQSYRSGLTVGLPGTSTTPLVAVVERPWIFSNQTLMRFTLAPVLYDVSSQLTFKTTGFVYNRATQTYIGSVIITNSSAQPVAGTVQMVITNLTAGVNVNNATGITGGNSYLTVPGVAGMKRGRVCNSEPPTQESKQRKY